MTEIPVYVFTGFLGAGKTTFIQKTLEDARFNDGTSTLVLQCEDGEEELDESRFANKKAVHLEKIDDQEALTQYYLADLLRKYRAKKVLVEYNGMWLFQKFLEAMPDGWMIYQEATFADCSDYLVYNANMRSLVGDKLKNADMIIFNNFKEGMDRMPFHKVVRSVSKRCNIIYNYGDRMEPDDIEDPLPFDIEAPIVEIADRDYAIWYRDMSEETKKYHGKTVRFKGRCLQRAGIPKGSFVIGRHVMTCCVEDIQFAGIICNWDKAAEVENESWAIVTAKLENRFHRAYGRKGPVLQVESLEPAEKPEEAVATFY